MTNLIVLASGDSWPDAVASGAFAARWDDPPLSAHLLLTFQGRVTKVTTDQVTALAPDRIVIIGGPSAVPASVEAQLRALAPTATVERVQGVDREETAVLLDRWRPSTVPVPPVTPGPKTFTGWLGNSGVPGKAVPHNAQGGTLPGDGRLGVCAPWVESGFPASVWKDGALLQQFGDLISWGRLGGRAIALAGDFAYVAMHQDGTANQGQPAGGSYGVRRYLVSTGGDAPFAPSRDQGGANGVNGSIRWTPGEVVTLAAVPATGSSSPPATIIAWLADGSVKAFDLNLTPVATPNPLPARPPQVPAGITVTNAKTVQIDQAGRTLHGRVFTAGACTHPTDPTRVFTPGDEYSLARDGTWTFTRHLVPNPPGHRDSTLGDHPATSALAVVGDNIFCWGQLGGVEVYSLATGALTGAFADAVDQWAIDVTADGRIVTCAPNGQVAVRANLTAAKVNGPRVTDFSVVERIVVTDAGDYLITGWPTGTNPPTWGQCGTKVALYSPTGTVTPRWTSTLPMTGNDGVKSICSAGPYFAYVRVGFNNQPEITVARLTDHVIVGSIIPDKPHGWCDIPGALSMIVYPDGTVRLMCEDNGEARIRVYMRTFT